MDGSLVGVTTSEQVETAGLSQFHVSDPKVMAQVDPQSDVTYQQTTGILSSNHEKPSQSSPSSDDAAVKSMASVATREMIHDTAQQLVEDLNHKRKQDTEFVSAFKKAQEMNVEKMVNTIEQNLYQLYSNQSEQMQVMLHDLFATLDRVAGIESELSQFKQVVGSLYKEVQPANEETN